MVVVVEGVVVVVVLGAFTVVVVLFAPFIAAIQGKKTSGGYMEYVEPNINVTGLVN